MDGPSENKGWKYVDKKVRELTAHKKEKWSHQQANISMVQEIGGTMVPESNNWGNKRELKILMPCKTRTKEHYIG